MGDAAKAGNKDRPQPLSDDPGTIRIGAQDGGIWISISGTGSAITVEVSPDTARRLATGLVNAAELIDHEDAP